MPVMRFPTIESIFQESKCVWETFGKFNPTYLHQFHSALHYAIFSDRSPLRELSPLCDSTGPERWLMIVRDVLQRQAHKERIQKHRFGKRIVMWVIE